VQIDPENNHTWLTPRIGRVRGDGGFDVIWQAKAAVKPDPYLAVSPLGARWIGDEVRVS
jgi:branched-chain amino acid transport system substrate-binding protein